MADLLRRYHGRLALSEKQAMILLHIQDKVMDTLVPGGVSDGPERMTLMRWQMTDKAAVELQV